MSPRYGFIKKNLPWLVSLIFGGLLIAMTVDYVKQAEALAQAEKTTKTSESTNLALKKELTAIVEKLVEDFNTADPVKYKSYFHMPHAKVSKTQVEWMDDENSPLVNFEKLRASGWIKSTVNEIEVIYATEDKGLVRLNFSRINKDEEVIVTTDGIYTFTKINGKWGIAVLFVGAKDLPLN